MRPLALHGSFARRVVASTLISFVLVSPLYATCGGGGGGGMGGIASGAAATVYYVPWVFLETATPPPGDLVVYWFPTGAADAKSSPMLTSRNLTLWSGKCVGVGLVGGEMRGVEAVHPRLSGVALRGVDPAKVADRVGHLIHRGVTA